MAKLAVTIKAVIILGLICIFGVLIYHLTTDFKSTALSCLGIALALWFGHHVWPRRHSD
ncbi:hypothetical protein [Levilactobacillus acidifarinae]|uniref:Uncharacterized protein n=1 Tax=Levilactobacillus acidifarinae DSM 19394 = JCM 15949 TaxID=1423715 RepID=A0A0R1LJ51_9LACO|nr:hypothetical protein [Levilactobacillus acidifarinae]KRK95632.1 hypothetical protein FD25_GL000047 [Levilactobacillus acidifarinae DSM 19394]GEO69367.1 hypothetical protein LAC03_12770 [Levilactobacillus acidifarinae]